MDSNESINRNKEGAIFTAKSDALRFALILSFWQPIFCSEYFRDIKGFLLYVLLPAVIIFAGYYIFALSEIKKGNNRMKKKLSFYIPIITVELLTIIALFLFDKVWIIALGVVVLLLFTLIYFKRK